VLHRASFSADPATSLRSEFRLVTRMIARSDVVEAIRARLIDRGSPVVREPAASDRVSDADIDGYFDLLGDGELDLEH
jgi:enoyl-CoA hydratase